VTPLFAAWVADTYWGRFKTINVAIAITIFGHLLLIISALPPVLEKGRAAVAPFILGIIISGIGTGAFKSNVSPLIAEQYKKTKMFVETTSKGERVIVDPTLTASRIFMYFYLFINIGALVGQITMVYAEKVRLFAHTHLIPMPTVT
jgi:proton-dependent oligopeptide transporter, POT family